MKIIITSLLTIGSVAFAQFPPPGTPPPSAPPQYDPANVGVPANTVPPASAYPAGTVPPANMVPPTGAYPAGAVPPAGMVPPTDSYAPQAGVPHAEQHHVPGTHHPEDDFEPPFFEGQEMPRQITGFIVHPHEGDSGEKMIDVLGSDGLIYGLEVTPQTDMMIELPEGVEEKDVMEMSPEEVSEMSKDVPMTFIIENGMITQVLEPSPVDVGALDNVMDLKHQIEVDIESHMHEADGEHHDPDAPHHQHPADPAGLPGAPPYTAP